MAPSTFLRSPASSPDQRPMMRALTLLSLILHLSLSSSSAASVVVEETCKSVASARPSIGCGFCTASLRSDPRSGAANRHELAVIAAKLSVANATGVRSKIEELVKEGTTPSLRGCFSVCSEVYSDAVDRLRDAIGNLNARQYGNAMTFLSAALDASENCEDAFSDAGVGSPSPLAKEDGDYRRLADIALTITASLG